MWPKGCLCCRGYAILLFHLSHTKVYDECQRYKGKREEEKPHISSRIFYDKYNYNEKRDKDSLRIYTWTTAQRLC